MSEAQEHSHSIRSFVTRSGRITAAQQRALTELWPRYGLEFTAAALELDAVFGRRAPRCVEIGFGNGEHLLALAAAEPARDFLGIEVHRPGIGRLLLALAAAGLGNVRLICHDAVEVFERQLPSASLAEILVLFPDPWPKKRHHKRRLVQAPFAALLASRLMPGGVLRRATDCSRTPRRCSRSSTPPRDLPISRPPTASRRGRRSVRRRASSGAAPGSVTRCST